MASGKYLSCLFMMMMWILSTSTQAHKFYVGGKDGWVLKPSEKYNHWAERSRFQVNDTLYFKFKKGSDSVLVVKKEDYHSCNTSNPIKKMEDGDSNFILDRSGPFFFISGNADNCNKGQKLIVVVMAVRSKPSPPSPPTAAPAPPKVPSASPGAETPQPSQSPSSPDAPAPAPSPSDKSGSTRFVASSVGVVLSVSIGVILVGLAGRV